MFCVRRYLFPLNKIHSFVRRSYSNYDPKQPAENSSNEVHSPIKWWEVNLEEDNRQYKTMPLNERIQILKGLYKDALTLMALREKPVPPSYLPPESLAILTKNKIFLDKDGPFGWLHKRKFSTSTAPIKFSNPLDIAKALDSEFKRLHINYAIGGSVAYTLYGRPRATKDLDMNIFHKPDTAYLNRVFEGYPCTDVEKHQARAGLILQKPMGSWSVDIFFAVWDYQKRAEHDCVEMSVDGKGLPFLSKDAIAIFKLIANRSQDQSDLKNLFEIHGNNLNVPYIREQLINECKFVRPNDPEKDDRVYFLDQLAQEYCGKSS